MMSSDLLDRELLHHYTTITCFSLSKIPSKQQIWQSAVPREAMAHEFLLHALLAISAVNLWYTKPAKRHLYEKAAVSHRYLALKTSIPALSEVTPQNCHALYAMSSIISVLSFVLPRSGHFVMPSEPVNDILSVFKLIRGVKTVLESAQEWIAKGSLGVLIGYNWNTVIPPLPDNVTAAFERLFDKNERETRDQSIREIYKSTIQSLKQAFEIYTVVRGEPGLVFTWLAVVQESYMELLERKAPMALTILAHYAVLLHTSNGQWWLQGRGAGLVEVVCEFLPYEWLPAARWPREAVARDWEWIAEIDPAAAERDYSKSPSVESVDSSKPGCSFKALRENWYQGFRKLGTRRISHV